MLEWSRKIACPLNGTTVISNLFLKRPHDEHQLMRSKLSPYRIENSDESTALSIETNLKITGKIFRPDTSTIDQAFSPL